MRSSAGVFALRSVFGKIGIPSLLRAMSMAVSSRDTAGMTSKSDQGYEYEQAYLAKPPLQIHPTVFESDPQSHRGGL